MKARDHACISDFVHKQRKVACAMCKGDTLSFSYRKACGTEVSSSTLPHDATCCRLDHIQPSIQVQFTRKQRPITRACHRTTRTLEVSLRVVVRQRFSVEAHLVQVLLYVWRLPTRSTLRKWSRRSHRRHEPSSKNHSEWSSAIAIAVERPFGGCRDSMGDATQLQQTQQFCQEEFTSH